MSSPPDKNRQMWRDTGERIGIRTAHAQKMPGNAWNRFSNRFALILVCGSLLYSLVHVLMRESQEAASGFEVVSLAHWQLEPGVRDAFEAMAIKYNQERVRRGEKPIIFKQLPVSEKGYGQWVTTQLMGGTAPDLIEMGNGLAPQVWASYRARYFSPVTQDIMQANPYNKGTEFEKTPWKQTYIDSMGLPAWDLQEYYDMGLSVFGVRIFYNKDLLKKLTAKLKDAGKWPTVDETPPNDTRKFLELCDRIGELKDEQNRPYYAIAGSKYTFERFLEMVVDPLTDYVKAGIDTDLDGNASPDETFLAAAEGRLKFDDPKLSRAMNMAREVTKRFQPGWRGLSRDDSVMLFVQQRSIFISTGSWDALTLKRQTAKAEPRFEMSIAGFPTVSPADPEWGDLAVGRAYERCSMAFAFGLTKTSRHPELALDLMRFLTNPENNEELNRIIGWIPAIKGARPNEFLKEFTPNFDGPQRGFNVDFGGQTQVVKDQVFSQLLLGENGFSIKNWSEKMNTDWLAAGFNDYERHSNEARDALKMREAVCAVFRARRMAIAPDSPQAEFIGKQYRRITALSMDETRKLTDLEKKVRAVERATAK